MGSAHRALLTSQSISALGTGRGPAAQPSQASPGAALPSPAQPCLQGLLGEGLRLGRSLWPAPLHPSSGFLARPLALAHPDLLSSP